MEDIRVPVEIVAKLNDSLQRDQGRVQHEFTASKQRLEKELDLTRRRQDQAYVDKLDGKITEEFWNRQNSEPATSEQRITRQLASLSEPSNEKLLSVARTLELAQKAHSLYLTQEPAEQAKLLSLVLSNCEVDEVSVYPKYNIPFNLVAQRAKSEDWLGGLDSNQDNQIQNLMYCQLYDLPTLR